MPRTYVQAAKSKRWSMNSICRGRSSPATHRICPYVSCGLLRSLEWFAGPLICFCSAQTSPSHRWRSCPARSLESESRSSLTSAYSERYVGRVLPLAFLAPDLTEAILEGTQPAHLSLERLRGSISVDWAQQR